MTLEVLYLDESGEDREPVMTLAGWLASEEVWHEFEIVSRSLFNMGRLDYLHTTDLRRGKEWWKSSDEENKLDFARAFFKIARECGLVGLEFSVRRENYIKRKQSLKVNPNVSPLGFCLVGILNQLHLRNDYFSILEENDSYLKIVAEAGHKNSNDLKKRFDAARQKFPRLKEFQLAEKRAVIALQAADFLAHYCRRLRVADLSGKDKTSDLKFFEAATEGLEIFFFFAEDFGR